MMKENGNSHYDALIFDLGKVIIDFDSRRALQRLEGRTPLTIEQLIARLKKTDALARFESGLMTPQEFYVALKKLLHFDLDFQSFSDIWSDIFLDSLLLDAPFFESLKPRYQLILMSNTNPMHMAYLRRRFPLLQLFDHHILSFEVGAMKPHEEIYRAAMQKAGPAAKRLFYVDDVAEYVQVAQGLGWDAVQFEGPDSLKGAMRERGIIQEQNEN